MTVENEWLRSRKGDDKEMAAVMAMIRQGDHMGVRKYLRDGGDANARNHMGYTLLHVACMEGKAQVVDVLLDGGASVNSCTVDQSTPLHRAASHGHKNVAEILLDKNAYINAQDKKGDTPLHLAAQGLQTAVARLLLARKADKTRLNLKKQIFTDVIGQQMIPVIEGGDTDTLLPWIDWGVSPDCRGAMNWSMLHHAAARGQLNCASLIIEKKGDVNILDSNSATPLHTACFHGNLKLSKLLISSGANINAQDQSGKTPLLSAVSGNSHESINLLLEKGGDIDIPDNEGNNFTHLVNEFLIRAVHNLNVNQVHGVLRARANPDIRDSSGLPALCYAAFKGSLMIADALLEYGADANITDQEYGKTPLHWAAYWGQLFILKAILDKGGSVKIKDKHGRSPLHEGAQEGHEDIITVLSARFAPLNDQDNDGNTPLHLAAKWGKFAQVEQLLELGAMELQNKNGLLHSDLSLIRAVRTGDKAAVISGLAWGGNSNTKDVKGCTLLHHAILRDMDEIVELLLKNAADVNLRDKHGRNALLLAAYRGNHQVMEGLLNAGIDINAQDWNGLTPLHWAANEGTIETVQFLLKHNADTTIKNNKGQLYIDLLLKHLYFAVRRNDLDSVIKMLEAGTNQHAIVDGTDLTPKEEACRREHWTILQHMVKVGPPREPKPEDPNTMLALQDVYRLFQDSGSSEDDPGEEDDTDAYWKMSNAQQIHSYEEVFKDEDGENLWSAWQEKPISAKDLFKEETAAFWKDLEEDLKQRLEEEKANAISATDFFKDDKPWWEKNDDDDDDEDDNEDGSEEADDEDDESDEDQRKLLKENAIPAKDIFKDEHPFFTEEIISKEEVMKNDAPWWENNEDAKETDRIISKEEIMKSNICWWENNDDNKDETCWPNNKENNEKMSEIISKEQVMNQDMPWWKNNEENEIKQDDKNEEVNGIIIPKDEIMKAEAPWWIQNKDVEVITKEAFYKEENQERLEKNKESEELEEQQPWWKNKQEKVISVKELFKNDHPRFTNTDTNYVRENEKVISLQEYLKDENSSWWDARNSPPKDESFVGNLKKSSLGVSYNDIPEDIRDNTEISNNLENNVLVNNIISAKEYFKEDERPWWYNENRDNGDKLNHFNDTENANNGVKEENSDDNEDQSAEDTSPKDEDTSSENEDDKSAYDDVEESRTDTWEDANDSVFSETSTMYSISDGDQKPSQPWWEEKKAWWEESSEATDSTPRQDIDTCEVIGENQTNHATSDDTNIEINTINHVSEHQNIDKHKSHHNTEVNQTNIDEMQSVINCYTEQELEVHSEDEIDDICDEEFEEPESDSGCISTTFEPINLINEVANEGLLGKLNAKIDLETIKENNEIQTEFTTQTNINLQRNNNEDISKHEQNKVTDARGIETLQEITSKVVTEMVSIDPVLEKNDNIDVEVANSDPYLLLSLDPSKLLEMGLQKSDSQTSGYESSLSLSTTDTNKSNNKNNNNIITNNINDSNIKTPLTQEISSSTTENPKSHPTLLVTHETPEIKTQDGTIKLSVHLHDPQPSETHLSPQTDIDNVKAFTADYKLQVSDAAKLAEKLVEQMESIINTNQDVNKNIDNININSTNDQMINSEYKESFKKLTPEVLNDNAITGDKIINKMDDCLAKVDASLAWIDAKIMKENNDSKSISSQKECLHDDLNKSIIAPEIKIIQNVSNQESPNKKGKLLDPVSIPKETGTSDINYELLTPKSDDEEFVFHEEVPVRTFHSPRLPRKNEHKVIQSNNSQSNSKSSKPISNKLSNQDVKETIVLEINSESLSPKSDNEEFIFHEVVPVRTFQSPKLPRKSENSVKQSNTSEVCASNSKLIDEVPHHVPIHVVKLPQLTEILTTTVPDNRYSSTVSNDTLDSNPITIDEESPSKDNKTNLKAENENAFNLISEEEKRIKLEQLVYQKTKNTSGSLENIQTTSKDKQKNNCHIFQETKKYDILTNENNKCEDNIIKNPDSKVSDLKNETENKNENTINCNKKDDSQFDNLKEMPTVSEQIEDNQSAKELYSNTYKSEHGSIESIEEIIPEDKSSKKGSIENLNSTPMNSPHQLLIPEKTLWRCSTYDTISLNEYDNMIYSLGKSTYLTLSDSEESLKGSRMSLTDPSIEGSPKPQHKEEFSEKTKLHMDETVSQKFSDVPQSPTFKVCHDSVDNVCTDPIVESAGSGSQEIKESSNNDKISILRDSLTKSDYGPTYKNSDSICKSSVKEKNNLKNKNKDQNKETNKRTNHKAENNQRNVDTDLQDYKHKDIKLDKDIITIPKQKCNSCYEAQPSSSQSTAELDNPTSLVLDQKKISQSPPTNKKSTSQNSQPPVVPQRNRGNKEKSEKLDREVADQYTVHSQNAQNQHTNTSLLYNADKSEDVKVGQLPPRNGEPQSSRGSTRNENQDKQNSKELKVANGKNDSVRKSSSCRVS